MAKINFSRLININAKAASALLDNMNERCVHKAFDSTNEVFHVIPTKNVATNEESVIINLDGYGLNIEIESTKNGTKSFALWSEKRGQWLGN